MRLAGDPHREAPLHAPPATAGQCERLVTRATREAPSTLDELSHAAARDLGLFWWSTGGGRLHVPPRTHALHALMALLTVYTRIPRRARPNTVRVPIAIAATLAACASIEGSLGSHAMTIRRILAQPPTGDLADEVLAAWAWWLLAPGRAGALLSGQAAARAAPTADEAVIARAHVLHALALDLDLRRTGRPSDPRALVAVIDQAPVPLGLRMAGVWCLVAGAVQAEKRHGVAETSTQASNPTRRPVARDKQEVEEERGEGA